MKRVSIIGLGLMGGSLGLALKAHGSKVTVHGYTRSPERRTIALQRGAVDAVFGTPGEAVEGADIVVYCAPILAIPRLVRETLPSLKRGALLTDVGSTKSFLVREIGRIARGMSVTFVGSHPIAGSELQGIEAAREDLYKGATVVVTPDRKTPKPAVKQIELFWKGMGADVCRMNPDDHDHILARTSHLPHLVAALLATTVGRGRETKKIARYCGAGFRDTSRVAEGGPDIWGDILKTNSLAVADELKAYRDQVDDLVDQLARGQFVQVQRFLEKGRSVRRTLLQKKTTSCEEAS